MTVHVWNEQCHCADEPFVNPGATGMPVISSQMRIGRQRLVYGSIQHTALVIGPESNRKVHIWEYRAGQSSFESTRRSCFARSSLARRPQNESPYPSPNAMRFALLSMLQHESQKPRVEQGMCLMKVSDLGIGGRVAEWGVLMAPKQ